ncbi:hypothetical protein GC163_21185 [bacterium]|nr:hypothetical protein [bacterium]
MPFHSEWIAGQTKDGRLLPLGKTNAFRARSGLPPLERSGPSPQFTHKPITKAATIPLPERPPAPSHGPGSELAAILQDLGVGSAVCNECSGRKDLMNRWGVSGCRENIDTITQWLRDAETLAARVLARSTIKNEHSEPSEAEIRKQQRMTRLTAAWRAVTSFTWINPLHPHKSIVERAIAQAEAKQAAKV